jgi:hypothetical protein
MYQKSLRELRCDWVGVPKRSEMGTVQSNIDHLNGYSDKQAHIVCDIWSEDDVLGRAKQRGIELTREQAQAIIDDIADHIDNEMGITWVTIDCYTDEYVGVGV